MKENDGGPAFPCIGHDWDGMTLRDWFAGQAMAAFIASNDHEAGDRITDIPEYAYNVADAMLAARAK